jgi:BBSome-interacting protein 1
MIHGGECYVPLTQKASAAQEVLPKTGLVVSEKGPLSEILCKPKIMPLKSITLQKLEEMEVSALQPPSRAMFAAKGLIGLPGQLGSPNDSRWISMPLPGYYAVVKYFQHR